MAVPDLNYVLNFLDQVKITFTYKPKKFKRLQILWQNYLKKNIDFSVLLNDLSGLLSDDPPLVERFNKLLPPEFKLKIVETQKQSKRLKCHRASNTLDEPEAKKVKSLHPIDDNFSMYGSWKEFSFFDQVKRLLGNECTYLNFLRCIQLFNKNLIDASELFEIIQPFISKSPNVLFQLECLLQQHLDSGSNHTRRKQQDNYKLVDEIKEYEIDFSSCRKMGSSYRALKVEADNKPACSGRTQLCKEVLNDIWVSFPLWSEDPATTSESHGGCKITSIQEFFYKCEDERFELDIVIDQVTSTIKTLEEVQNKMNSMLQEDVVLFQLDDSLGGSSNVLQKKVIERIYGDKAKDLLEGLKMKPFIGVPIALRRLRAKQQEWMEHRVKFNKIWKENTEKQSLRSVNCELTYVKQNDHKDARSKVIINEAEAIQEESLMLSSIYGEECSMNGKHYVYSQKETFDDLNNLLHFNLKCLSEDCNSDNVGSGATNVLNGTSTIATASLSSDKNLLSFCKKTLNIISMLDGKVSAIAPPPSSISNGSIDPPLIALTPENTRFFKDSPCTSAFQNELLNLSDARIPASNDCSTSSTTPSIASMDEVVMYQTSRWLILVSLHYKLYTRLAKIRAVSEREWMERDACDGSETSLRKKSKAVYLDMTGREDCGTLYNFALSVLRSYVAGACESSAYEEHIRKVMSKVKNESSFNYHNVGYWIMSLDKLLKNVIRELQQLAGDEITKKGMELFETFIQSQEARQMSSSLIGGTDHVTYRHNSLNLLSRDFCYKITFKKKWKKIIIELMDLSRGEFTKEGATKVLKIQKWKEYISDFLTSEVTDVPFKPFLKRNLRKEAPVDMINTGSDQLVFQLDSFKMIFASSSHSVLCRSSGIHANPEEFKKQALRRHNKFLHYWNIWKSINLSPLHEQRFMDLMFGVKKNQTRIFEMNDCHHPPYRLYRKYISL